MKHINKQKTAVILSFALLLCAFSGCSGSVVYPDRDLSVYIEQSMPVVEGFAADLCVANDTVMPDGELAHAPEAAGLFNATDGEVLYAKNIHQQMEPASITKLLTALVAFKYGNMDDMITVPGNITISEYGAKLSGLLPGDQVTLRDVMYALLVYSGNDAGLIIADHISGDQQAFVELMNEEARLIGATNTHFVNPHGLTAKGHVTTVYDLYLILNALLAYPEFTQIISTKSYSCIPRDADLSLIEENGGANQAASGDASDSTEDTSSGQASDKQVKLKLVWNNTNQYLTGETKAPDGVTVLGGKTGTTAAAGSCLIILSTDTAGKQYISVVMHAPDKQTLYAEMNDLLEEIVK